MLDNYEQTQNKIYKILTKQLQENKCSHAYLFNKNNYKDADSFIFSFVKALYCKNYFNNNHDCLTCNICQNIEKNLCSEIKIINPEGIWIKKEQLIELKREFSKTAIESNKKIYIINNAECLNASSANTMLKFLEEPEKNIYAILITNNIYKILDTIKSRCQILTFRNYIESESNIEQIKNIISSNKTLEELELMINNTIDFIESLEQIKLNTILYTKELIYDKYDDNNNLKELLGIMELFYKDLIDYKIKGQTTLFDLDQIRKISDKNTLKQLNKKLNVIITQIEKIQYNVNTKLLIDKLIIDIGVE